MTVTSEETVIRKTNVSCKSELYKEFDFHQSNRANDSSCAVAEIVGGLCVGAVMYILN